MMSGGGAKVGASRSHIARSISTAATARARWAQAAAALRLAKFGPGARVASPTQPLYHLSFFGDVVSVRAKLLNYSHHDAAQWARLELVSRRIDAGCSPFIHSNGNVVSATTMLAMMKRGTACAVALLRQDLMGQRKTLDHRRMRPSIEKQCRAQHARDFRERDSVWCWR